MLKVTSTLKGLLALALGSFALGASAALPELSTDDAPKYYFIKNLRSAGNAVTDNNPGPFVNASGVNQLTHGAVDSDVTSLYKPASALWYFVSAGEKKNVTISGSNYEVTPVYIKNLTKPGKAFNVFGSDQFTTDGCIYYLFSYTKDYTGYAIMRAKDGVAFDNGGLDMTDTNLCWSDHGGNQSTAIKAYKADDTGSVFDFEPAVESKIEGTKNEFIAEVKQELAPSVNLLSTILGAVDNTAVDDITAAINSASTIEEVVALHEGGIYAKLDRKVVYMVSNGREAAGKGKYIYLNKKSNRFEATDHKCVLGKWQFIYNGDGTSNNFVLRNIATDTYISPAGSGVPSSATAYRTNVYKFEMLAHKDGKGFVLRFASAGNKTCQKIDNADNSYMHGNNSNADPSNISDVSFSFSFEPANIAESEIAESELYVIRSKRGKVEEDSYKYNTNVKYPGSLVTAYPADRQLARERVGYHNGAHLEMYAPGSVWKFVKDGDGWKIYSLIGEQTEAAENKGLKVVGDYVDVAAEPSVFYLKEVTDGNALNKVPNTYALCTAQDGGKYVTVSDVNENGDYFLTLGDNAPSNNIVDDPAAFLIESIGTVHSNPQGANPEQEYIDYAKNLHMFQSIKPVLDDADMEYILAEKKKNDELYDYANIGSIAEANEFMSLGDMTASSRAFQRLDGKMIRLKSRLSNVKNSAYYLYPNTDNDLKIVNNLTGQELSSVWVVELPDGETSARMRQIKLRNLKTNTYITQNLTTGDEAQTLTVRRRPSLDQSEFFLALTKDYERNTALKMQDVASDMYDAIPVSENTVWGANSSLYAHWTVETAVSTAAPTVTLTKHSEKDDTYVLTVVKPAGVTAMSLTGIASIGDVTVEKAANTRELTEPATVTLTADDDGNITGEIPAQLASTTADNVYTVKLPAALLAMDNNVSPAVEANVTVPQDTSTGIKEVNVAEKGATVIYDLQGRRVSKAGKGVYIINGVKTLVK